MQITEMDKLLQDRERLLRLKGTLTDIRNGLEIGRRSVNAWIRLRITRWIAEVDDKIEEKQREIEAESARIRKEQRKAEKHGKIATGRAEGRTDDTTADHPAAAPDRGRHEADGSKEHQRAGSEAGIRGELELLEPVRGVAAGNAAGGRAYARAGGSAEDCLRMRYRERNGLRDWQREIMERDRTGETEERMTI